MYLEYNIHRTIECVIPRRRTFFLFAERWMLNTPIIIIFSHIFRHTHTAHMEKIKYGKKKLTPATLQNRKIASHIPVKGNAFFHGSNGVCGNKNEWNRNNNIFQPTNSYTHMWDYIIIRLGIPIKRNKMFQQVFTTCSFTFLVFKCDSVVVLELHIFVAAPPYSNKNEKICSFFSSIYMIWKTIFFFFFFNLLHFTEHEHFGAHV